MRLYWVYDNGAEWGWCIIAPTPNIAKALFWRQYRNEGGVDEYINLRVRLHEQYKSKRFKGPIRSLEENTEDFPDLYCKDDYF